MKHSAVLLCLVLCLVGLSAVFGQTSSSDVASSADASSAAPPPASSAAPPPASSAAPPPASSAAPPPASTVVVPPPPASTVVVPPPPASTVVVPPPPASTVVVPPPPATSEVVPPPPATSGVVPPPPATSGVVPPPPATSGVVPPPPATSGVVPPPPATSGVVPPPPATSGVVPPPPATSGVVPPPPATSGVVPPPPASTVAPPPLVSGAVPPPPPSDIVVITNPNDVSNQPTNAYVKVAGSSGYAQNAASPHNGNPQVLSTVACGDGIVSGTEKCDLFFDTAKTRPNPCCKDCFNWKPSGASCGKATKCAINVCLTNQCKKVFAKKALVDNRRRNRKRQIVYRLNATLCRGASTRSLETRANLQTKFAQTATSTVITSANRGKVLANGYCNGNGGCSCRVRRSGGRFFLGGC